MAVGFKVVKHNITDILVTGASGFIGGKLCEALKEKGWQTRALLRNAADGSWDDFIIADLIRFSPLLMPQNIETVFHLAGKAHALSESKQDEEEYFQVNTEGTRKLLEASQQAGVKKFIYFSSVKAAGDIDELMNESVSVEADTPYGRSKRAAEKLVLEGGYVPHPVVIRPSMVYGNTEKGNLPKMIRAIASGQFPPLPEFGNRRSMVHVDDVVQAAILAAENPDAAGQIYIVADGQAYSTRQMYEWICEVLHKPVFRWHVPLSVLKGLGKVGDMIGAARGRRFMFDSDALDKLAGSAEYDSEKICRELGFKPRHHLRDSLPDIVRFLGLGRS